MTDCSTALPSRRRSRPARGSRAGRDHRIGAPVPRWPRPTGFEIKLFGRGSHGSRPQSGHRSDRDGRVGRPALAKPSSRAKSLPTNRWVVNGGEPALGQQGKHHSRSGIDQVERPQLSPPMCAKRCWIRFAGFATAEATASNAPRPPEFRPLNQFPILVNDPEATGRTINALARTSATTESSSAPP